MDQQMTSKLPARQDAFTPKLTRPEQKGDVTTAAAKAITAAETAAREAKTERLRTLRLKKEAEAQAPPRRRAAGKKPPARRLTA